MNIIDETELTATVVANQRSYTVPKDVADALRAARAEGALQRAISRAAAVLPLDYIINVSVECGAGWVSVDAGVDAWQVEANDRTMAQQVDDEIDDALAELLDNSKPKPL